MSTRVVIADDHPPQRAGVRLALEDGGFQVLAEVGDADSAVAAVAQHQPEVALLDIHMPGNGISAAARIAEKHPDTAVVMLTVSRDDDDLFDALRVGASGYLLKDIDAEQLPEALEAVLRGEGALPPTLVTRLMEEFRGPSRRRRLPLSGHKDVDLTTKEWEVLELMRAGCSTQDMADKLYVSPVTVRSHISQILKKLRVKSRAEAIRLFDQH